MFIYIVIHMWKFSKIYHSKIHIVNIFGESTPPKKKKKKNAENVSRARGWVNYLIPWWCVYRQTSGILQVWFQTTAIKQVMSLRGVLLLPTGVLSPGVNKVALWILETIESTKVEAMDLCLFLYPEMFILANLSVPFCFISECVLGLLVTP